MKKYRGAFFVQGGIVNNVASVSVGRGTVNGYEPIVGGIPISGCDNSGRMVSGNIPIVQGDAQFDNDRRCYVCIKARVSIADGKMNTPPEEEDLTVVISKFTKAGAPQEDGYSTWYHPIALFTQGYTNSEGVEVSPALHQIAYHNLLHYIARPLMIGQMGTQGPSGRLHHFFSGI